MRGLPTTTALTFLRASIGVGSVRGMVAWMAQEEEEEWGLDA
jgi:hypothetical protein